MRRLSPDYSFATPGDLAAAREAIREGSRSFYLASLLLPQAVRDDSRSLYAFCREADDAVDRAREPARAVEGLRERLRCVYDGTPRDIACDRAMAEVVHRHAIPRDIPEGLIEGFAWDIDRRSYEDLTSLVGYCVRVAATVGVMMSLVMGRRSPDAIARACDLGVAMQLTNIARDVGEDARMGRVYLPLAWLREAEIDVEAWLAAPAFVPGLAGVVARLQAAADHIYDRATPGIALLPVSCRPAIHAARLLYREIGREVVRNGCDSVSRRAVVRGRTKSLLLLRAVLETARTGGYDAAPILEEASWVAAAVARAGWAGEGGSFGARAAWLIDLLARGAERRT
jgi:phytoene synthase